MPEEEATTITGNFVTKVFEGPYKNAKLASGNAADNKRSRIRK
ncbi:hydrolase [Pseudohalocynthiibacter sp. F2068]